MTLQQLEYALALHRAGNYSRAAKTVGISQPGMSIQIRKLEEEIGLTLFDRSQKRVRTTPAGQRFLEHAQLLLTQSRQLRELAVELKAEFSGKIEMGIIPTLAPYLLPLFIQQLNDQFPKLTLHVQEAITEEIVHGIKDGKFDVGIIATPVKTRIALSTTPLFYEGFLLFVSNRHPLFGEEPIDIAGVPPGDIWLLKEGNCLRNQVDDICELHRKGKYNHNLFQFESNSIESLCRIVEYKGGVTVLPELTTLHFDSEREHMIKVLAGPRRVREISMVYLPNHVRAPLLDKIGALIKASVPKKLLETGDVTTVNTNVEV